MGITRPGGEEIDELRFTFDPEIDFPWPQLRRAAATLLLLAAVAMTASHSSASTPRADGIQLRLSLQTGLK